MYNVGARHCAWVDGANRLVVLVKVGTGHRSPIGIITSRPILFGESLYVICSARAIVTHVTDTFAIDIVIAGDFIGNSTWVLGAVGGVSGWANSASDFIAQHNLAAGVVDIANVAVTFHIDRAANVAINIVADVGIARCPLAVVARQGWVVGGGGKCAFFSGIPYE